MRRRYDLVIIGAGLGGLTLAIQIAKRGYKVCLIEKNNFPFHRVCGEYISLESVNFLRQCGFDIGEKKDIPIINQLTVSAPNGQAISMSLPLGGFGISRYRLDDELVQKARACGVVVLEGKKVEAIQSVNNIFSVQIGQELIDTRLVVGAFGKRSNLDISLQREFVQKKPDKEDLYIGVKYHIKYDIPKDRIYLHNFTNGYCGLSAIENDQYCLCYMTTAKNLEKYGSIQKMEEELLMKNKFLHDVFTNAEFLWDHPKTIAQISFARKELIHHNVIMLGDAAGMIPPLCGNGMSMAMHGSKMLSELIPLYLDDKIDYITLCKRYANEWESEFGTRLRVGRWLQSLFGRRYMTSFLLSSAQLFPYLAKKLISKTHGKAF